jgi:hypothetical protein
MNECCGKLTIVVVLYGPRLTKSSDRTQFQNCSVLAVMIFSKTSQPPSNRPHTTHNTTHNLKLNFNDRHDTLKDRSRIHYTITCTRDACTGPYHTPELILHKPLNLLDSIHRSIDEIVKKG